MKEIKREKIVGNWGLN